MSETKLEKPELCSCGALGEIRVWPKWIKPYWVCKDCAHIILDYRRVKGGSQ